MDIINYSKIKKLEEQINSLIPLIGLGGVIESGTNENGRYLKFADGTLICTNRISITTTAENTPTIIKWVYPATFTTPHNIKCLTGISSVSVNAQFTGNVQAMVVWDNSQSRDISVSASRNQIYTVDVMAIWRWK